MTYGKWLLPGIVVSFLLTGCTQQAANPEENESEVEQAPNKEDSPNTDVSEPETEEPEDNSDGGESADNESVTSNEEASIEEEQKQMALETLNGLAENAKEGKMYRPAQSFIIGQTTRDDVIGTIGEPEDVQGEFDHYHGSMGNPSVAFSYDAKGVLAEARYFGTNVERQTNLGGITEKDLIEQLGNPTEDYTIQETGEKNMRYNIGSYDLQFVIGEDGTPDHVNLKKWR